MKSSAVNGRVLLVAAACVSTVFVPAAFAQQSSSRSGRSPQSAAATSRKAPMTPVQAEELRGDIFMARKMFLRAIETYKDVLLQHPKDPKLLNKIGIAYQQLNDWHQAERFYKRACKVDKHFAEARNNLGTVEFSRRKYKSAIKQYEKAIRINPRSAVAFSNLGYAYLARKKYNDAILAFRVAIVINPDVFRDFNRAGTAVEERGYDNPGVFYYMLAKTFAMLGDAKRCALYLEKSREEGYKKFTDARSDPAFKSVLKDPRVQHVLAPPAVAERTF
jgi:tetratricopeptide (TPR) repeat protein